MKKVFMLMAFAAFFSMAATSCAGEEGDAENTENAEGEGEGEGEEEAH